MSIDEQRIESEETREDREIGYEAPEAVTFGDAEDLTRGPSDALVPDNPDANQGYKRDNA